VTAARRANGNDEAEEPKARVHVRPRPDRREAEAVHVVFRSLDDVNALRPGEIGWCDYVDLSVSWVDGDDWPQG
jgi:hypothetical protein